MTTSGKKDSKFSVMDNRLRKVILRTSGYPTGVKLPKIFSINVHEIYPDQRLFLASEGDISAAPFLMFLSSSR